jgi:hypothetical protein
MWRGVWECEILSLEYESMYWNVRLCTAILSLALSTEKILLIDLI